MLNTNIRRIQELTAEQAGRAYFRFWPQLGSITSLMVGFLLFIGAALFVAVVAPFWTVTYIARAYGEYGLLLALFAVAALAASAAIAWGFIERRLAKPRK
jgi:hypothetical protein